MTSTVSVSIRWNFKKIEDIVRRFSSFKARVQSSRKCHRFHGRIRVSLHVALELGEKTRHTRQVRDPTTCCMYGQVVRIWQRKAGISRLEGNLMAVFEAIGQVPDRTHPVAIWDALTTVEPMGTGLELKGAPRWVQTTYQVFRSRRVTCESSS